MVLTLLPMSVFAAVLDPGTDTPESGKVNVTYYPKADASKKITTPGWYWMQTIKNADNTTDTKYHSLSSGVVSGVGTSGTWYSEADLKNGAAGALKQTSFTLLGNITVGDVGGLTQNLTVDTNGHTLTISGTPDMTKVTSLTVYDKQYAADRTKTQGSVSWAINHAPAADGKNTQSFTLNLYDGGQVSGNVSLTNYATHTVNLRNYGKLNGTLTLSGKTDNSNSQTINSTTNSTITGKIEVSGNSSQVTLSDTTATTGLDLTGTGTRLSVAGTGNVGPVKLIGTTDTTKKTASAPQVNISQGTVTSITQDASDVLESAISVTVGENGTVSALQIQNSANVTINKGNLGNVTVPSGSVTVSGPNAAVGTITLNSKGNTKLTVNGKDNKIVGVTATNGATLTVDVAAEPSNDLGAVSLTGYKGHGIKGGTFTSLANPQDCLVQQGAGSLAYQTNLSANKITYYGEDQLLDALTDSRNSGTGNAVTIVGQDASLGGGTITFQREGTPIGYLTYHGQASIKLPSLVFGQVNNWLWTNGPANFANKPYPSGQYFDTPIPVADVTLDTQASGQVVTKINEVVGSGIDANSNVRATLSGNTISLSGAVDPSGGLATINLKLKTDLLTKDNVPIDVDIVVYHNVNGATPRTYFANMTNLQGGLSVSNDGSQLLLADGSYYTINGSGLKVVAGLLYTDYTSTEIQAVYTGSGTNDFKKAVADTLAGTKASTNAEFTWTSSPAMQQAINAAQATISDSQIKSWVEAAQRKYWTDNNVGSPTKDQLAASYYQEAWLVPYLYVSASNYNITGALTATLTPYYRIEIRGTSGATDATHPAIVAQQGRTLGALSGTFGTVTVKFHGLPSSFDSLYMHQDSTYVYTPATKVYTVNHAGNNGLGTIVLNAQPGLVTMKGIDGNAVACAYDTLQAAVDDTVPATKVSGKDKNCEITVAYGYKGSGAISVTGEAREIKIIDNSNTGVTSSASKDIVNVSANGNTYTVQLLKNVAPAGQNIVVSSATGGSASVSANPATVGSKVTITLSASAGYTASGVSVKTSSGATVSVSGSGSTYTFTMPSGTVTVTPSFTKTQVVNPTVSVGGASTGTGTASTNTSGQVAPGTTVTVTTNPGVGQRTMGLNVTGATAIRTGANTFQFSVPSGYTNVVVTPKFDVNNGTLFEDVWSTEYYSNPVRWAVEKGVTNGESTYRFGSGNSCTREQMVTFLYRAAGSPAVGNVNNPFWDVRAGEYYYNAVMWAVSKGITNGVSANQFGVGQPVTRAQAVSFLYRYEGSPAASTNSGFYDVNTREYYAKAVSWANAKGVTNGTSSTMFSPNDYCPREQIVTFLYRDITGNRA